MRCFWRGCRQLEQQRRPPTFWQAWLVVLLLNPPVRLPGLGTAARLVPGHLAEHAGRKQKGPVQQLIRHASVADARLQTEEVCAPSVGFWHSSVSPRCLLDGWINRAPSLPEPFHFPPWPGAPAPSLTPTEQFPFLLVLAREARSHLLALRVFFFFF